MRVGGAFVGIKFPTSASAAVFDSRGEPQPPWRHGRALFVVVDLAVAAFLIAIPQLMGLPAPATSAMRAASQSAMNSKRRRRVQR